MYEKPHGKTYGYVPAHGSGENGVLIVLEAAGADEEIEGIPVVGKAGYTLFQQLKRVGIERDGFRIHNVLSCRPPDNKLAKTPWELSAIEHCAPNLDKTISDHVTATRSRQLTPVIVTLGQIAFRRVMKLDWKSPVLREDYIAYPMWSDAYSCWVLAADHPAYLLRGNTHLWPVLTFVVQRALEIASQGLTLDTHDYLLDPKPGVFNSWIQEYRHACVRDPENTFLSYDIETPYKKKKDEQDLSKDEDADHTILRISFSYRPNSAVSVSWSAEYLAGIEELLNFGGNLVGWNCDNYDRPRVLAHMTMAGAHIDAMVAWHILNSSLPKSLGFVTPFYVQTTGMWKHLSEAEPAFYNAKDADMALRNWLGVKKNLGENDLYHVFERHVLKLNKALTYMTGKGVLRDNEMRAAAEEKLSGLLDGIEAGMELAVPREARKLKVYKSIPKELKRLTDGEIADLIEKGEWTTVTQRQTVKKCPICGLVKPKKSHFKAVSVRKMKLGLDNVCEDQDPIVVEEDVTLFAKPLGFKISKLGLSNYQKALRHQAITSRKEKKVTFNEDAIVLLMKKHPKDELYPKILKHREVQKLLTTYIGVTLIDGKLKGGMQVGRDGRIHTTYSHNPSTLRLASQDPNLQNLPRYNKLDPDALSNVVRNLIVAEPGSTLYARDYSGIEAVLTGYFALDPGYVRLSKVDVHTYYTVHALYELDGVLKSSDLPDISWPDERLFPYLGQLKREFSHQRNSLYKHLVHAANFMQGAKGAQEKIFSETRVEYPLRTVQRVMDVYYELFPSIRKLHTRLLEQAEKDGFLRNPFGYVHRFSRVYEYKREFGEWTKRPGADGNKVVAFLAQSTAAAMIKEAIMRLYYDRFVEAGQYMRLQVHDEILSEVPDAQLGLVDEVTREEMEKPVPELRLPESWGMGENLVVLTEAKQGKRWGMMK